MPLPDDLRDMLDFELSNALPRTANICREANVRLIDVLVERLAEPKPARADDNPYPPAA